MIDSHQQSQFITDQLALEVGMLLLRHLQRQYIQIKMEEQPTIIMTLLKQTPVASRCHLFILTNHSSTTIEADFRPSAGSASERNQASIVPKFNNDSNHFTPSFILQCQEGFYKGNLLFERIKFEERLENHNEKNFTSSGRIANPANSYCMICHLHFQNYLEHINEVPHQKSIQNAMGNQFIKELEAEFQLLNRKTKTILKKKVTKKKKKQSPPPREKVIVGRQSSQIKVSCHSTNILSLI